MNRRKALLTSALVVTLSLGGLAVAGADTANPTQAEALAGLDAARRYIEQHPDTPLPTTTPTATSTTAPPTTAPPTPSTTTATTAPPTTTPPSPTATGVRYASGMPWSSGVWGAHDAAAVAGFASARARPVDNIEFFTSRESWSALLNTWYLSSGVIPAGFTGDLVASVPLWPENSTVGTNADTNWAAFARALAAKDSNAYVRLGWEMNLPSSYWRVTAANRTAWIAAFNRAVNAMHSVAPALRIVFNPNWGADQTDTDSRSVFQAVKANVDVYGIDIYDSYPPDTSDANAAQRLNGVRGLQDSLNYATANGKLFAIPEWGVACNVSGCAWQGNAGGDNPRFINDTLDFLAANRGKVAFESYFNEPASYIRSNLYPTSTNPQAAAAYRAKLTAIAAP